MAKATSLLQMESEAVGVEYAVKLSIGGGGTLNFSRLLARAPREPGRPRGAEPLAR